MQGLANISLPSISGNGQVAKSVSIKDQSVKNYFNAFPNEKELQTLLPNIFVINKPMSGVGGDGYWAYSLNNYEMILVAYDCMGHGRIASIMTRIYLNALKQSVEEDKNAPTNVILSKVHEKMKSQFHKNDTNMAGTAADMAIVKINIINRTIQYSGASMDLVKIQNGKLEKIKADKRAVGDKFDIDREYKCVDIELSSNKKDRFFMYSDGITDLFGGPFDKKFKFGNLKILLNDAKSVDFENVRYFIEDRLESWSGFNPPLDDQLMIGFQL